MAKKKLSKKNKTLLLTIGAVAVGAGFILAKAFKKKDESNLAGIGAVKKKKNKPLFYYQVVKLDPPLYGMFYEVDIVTPKGSFPLFGAETIEEAIERTIRELGEKPIINVD